MKLRALLLSLAGAGLFHAAPASAADDFCSRLVVQMVQQICQYLPNGLTVCQPVAVMVPPVECAVEGQQPVQVPLGPPSLSPFTGYVPPLPAPATAAAPGLPAIMPPAAGPAAAEQAAPAPVPAKAEIAAPAPAAADQSAPAPVKAEVVQAPAPAKAEVAAPAPAAAVEQAASTPVKAEVVQAPAPAKAEVAAPAPAAAAQQAAPAPVKTEVVQAPAPAKAEVAAPAPAAAAQQAAPTPVKAEVVQAPAPAKAEVAAPALAAAAEQAAPAPVKAEVAQAPAPAKAEVAAVVEQPAKPVVTPTRPLAVAPVEAASITPAGLAVTAEQMEALAHFDFDSADLTAAGRAALDAWLTHGKSEKPLRVSGHADRLGPEPYNLKLSLRRAETVKQYLANKGVDPRRMQLEAKGESEPVKSCKGGSNPQTKACLAPNRRVQISPE